MAKVKYRYRSFCGLMVVQTIPQSLQTNNLEKSIQPGIPGALLSSHLVTLNNDNMLQ